mmetsp:Transcript_32100/g.84110  ORF Transcript_32100/g.84110 Transcript_32100/m.84110 type:complete len:222 (+) Transcript_32100:2909-3574(+)
MESHRMLPRCHTAAHCRAALTDAAAQDLCAWGHHAHPRQVAAAGNRPSRESDAEHDDRSEPPGKPPSSQHPGQRPDEPPRGRRSPGHLLSLVLQPAQQGCLGPQPRSREPLRTRALLDRCCGASEPLHCHAPLPQRTDVDPGRRERLVGRGGARGPSIGRASRARTRDARAQPGGSICRRVRHLLRGGCDADGPGRGWRVQRTGHPSQGRRMARGEQSASR